MERELRGLPDGAAEDPDPRKRQEGPADLPLPDGQEDLVVPEHPGRGEQEQEPDQEPEVADPVHDERLLPGVGGRLLLEPEPDERVGGKPDQLPEDVDEEEALGQDEPEHGERENGEVGEEPAVLRVAVHVPDREQVHEEGDQGHHDEHHGRQIVHEDPRVDDKPASQGEPRDHDVVPEVRVVDPEDLEEDHDRHHEPRADRGEGDPVPLPGEPLPDRDIDEEGEQRQERDDVGVSDQRFTLSVRSRRQPRR